MRRLVALRSVRTLAFPDRSREGLIAALRGKTAACPAVPSAAFLAVSTAAARANHHQRDHWRIRSGRTEAHDRAVRTPGRVSNEAVHGTWRLCGAGGGGAAPQPVRHRARRCRDGAPRHRGRRASARDTPGASATRHDQPLGQLHRTGPAWAGAGHCRDPAHRGLGRVHLDGAARRRLSTASCWRRRMAPIVCFTPLGEISDRARR